MDDDEDEDESDDKRDDDGEDVDVAAKAGGLRVVSVGFEGSAGFGFAGRVGHRRRPFYRIRRAAEGRGVSSTEVCVPPPPPPWGCGKWFILQGCFSTVNQVLPSGAPVAHGDRETTPSSSQVIGALGALSEATASRLRQDCIRGPRLRSRRKKKRTVAVDSPFPTVLMVAGAGRECKENRRVRGYKGTALYS